MGVIVGVFTEALTQFYSALSRLHNEIGDNDLLNVHYDLGGDAQCHRIYRLYDKDLLIGYAVVSEFPNGMEDDNGIPYHGTRWWLQSFVIIESHQRQGYGRKLLTTIREDIPTDLYLITLVKSVEFYIRCGAWSIVDREWIFEEKSPMILPKHPISTRDQFDLLIADTCFKGSNGFETTTNFFVHDDDDDE